jgi:hypothetical protein
LRIPDGSNFRKGHGAARGLVELSAFVYHHTKIILKEANELSLELLDSFPAAVRGIVMTLQAASHFAQVTRFNWSAMVRRDMDEFFTAWDRVEERVKATQILTLIDKLPGEEQRAARFFYQMLCDYVHPNVGAHTLVVSCPCLWSWTLMTRSMSRARPSAAGAMERPL